MRIKKGFKLRRIGDENIIISSGVENVNFTRVISLNDTAARLWEDVEGIEFTHEKLAELLLARYETDEATALKDAKALSKAWLDAGITEE